MRVAVVRIVAGRVAMARMRFVSGEEFLSQLKLKAATLPTVLHIVIDMDVVYSRMKQNSVSEFPVA